jgi:hypothetical protein
MLKSILLWILAVLITLAFVVYQRMTGPTHPLTGQQEINNSSVRYKLIRTHEGQTDAEIAIAVPDESISGTITYKRYKTDDEWTTEPMELVDGKLKGYLPPQPPAGKLAYRITLMKDAGEYELTEEPVIIRFKGVVPKYVLFPHILFMFTAMLFSMRTGMEALRRGKHTLKYAWVTLVTLFVGGLILGPIIQNFAFGDFWTGWPVGQDLTDNKTLVAFIFWLIAVIRMQRNPRKQTWAIIAAIVLFAVYLIPHSLLGSEFDYEAGEVTTGNM